ncbi:MAG: gamma-glutamylcyclotransferase (GGCT)/AIG2-like uncharacterized protein YtfP [Planctomycetota bacterium]|jgi:gamma-glutamylcyclotransferase (GGCT)/AIG2-like uncharacterized protein YtfP
MICVFVYGTLKRGQRNNYLLSRAEFLGEFATLNGYSMFEIDDYPAVCVGGECSIEGEIYVVTAAEFAELDKLELCPDYYQRMTIETHYGEAWMYVLSDDLCQGREKISGNWSSRLLTD